MCVCVCVCVCVSDSGPRVCCVLPPLLSPVLTVLQEVDELGRSKYSLIFGRVDFDLNGRLSHAEFARLLRTFDPSACTASVALLH